MGGGLVWQPRLREYCRPIRVRPLDMAIQRGITTQVDVKPYGDNHP